MSLSYHWTHIAFDDRVNGETKLRMKQLLYRTMQNVKKMNDSIQEEDKKFDEEQARKIALYVYPIEAQARGIPIPDDYPHNKDAVPILQEHFTGNKCPNYKAVALNYNHYFPETQVESQPPVPPAQAAIGSFSDLSVDEQSTFSKGVFDDQQMDEADAAASNNTNPETQNASSDQSQGATSSNSAFSHLIPLDLETNIDPEVNDILNSNSMDYESA